MLRPPEIKNKIVGWEEVPLDLFTPVSAFLKLRKNGAICLLESVEKGETVGRYSFIGLAPEREIVLDGFKLRTFGQEKVLSRADAKQAVDSVLLSQELLPLSEIPFVGGWAGYVGYDFVRFLEEIDLPVNGHKFPLMYLFQINKLLVFDHVKNTGKILVIENELNRKKVEEEINSIRSSLSLNFNDELSRDEILLPKEKTLTLQSSLDKAEFIDRVRRAKEYIRAGDIFQVVLSVQFQGQTRASAFDLYRALRILNPSPYMFYFDFGKFQLIGSSPESHIKVVNDQIMIKPIAGTRKRGNSGQEEQVLEKELRTDPKEQAEHVMLVDLARNDLGKICRPGSVQVSEFMGIEKYSHVMHLVSKVEGKLIPNLSFYDLLQATFPAGTVSGAPKLRAMEIIREMEPVPRGPYAGIVGYLSNNGQVDFCIGIRMILYQESTYYLQAGAGIVADSNEEREYQEIRNKIRGLHQAIRLAEKGGRI
ncbi:MAG: anthranilate synthase component I [Candidatus Aminicenantes bacterium]|nr:MAG: anthranilate synthase component I [Candidatus Aminicenantes bacterium]